MISTPTSRKCRHFSKKFITFEQIEIFEFIKSNCEVQDAYFYKKNYELRGNKNLSLRCQLALYRKRKNADVYEKIHKFSTIQIVQIVKSFRKFIKNYRDFNRCTLRHAIKDEKSKYDSKNQKSFENIYKLYENS